MSSVDWLEHCHLAYSTGKLAGIPVMMYDRFMIIKIMTEMPNDMKVKIVTLETICRFHHMAHVCDIFDKLGYC